MTIETMEQALARITDLESQVNKSIPKERVVTVARKYGQRHNWCSVIEDALREIGALTPPVQVVVPMTVTQQVRVTVDGDAWADAKTDEEKRALLASLAPIVGLISAAPTALSIGRSRDLTIGDIPEPGTVVVDDPGPGREWVYTGQEGRVRHSVPVAEGRGRYFMTLCGSEVSRGIVNLNSPRGTGDNCRRCTSRVNP